MTLNLYMKISSTKVLGPGKRFVLWVQGCKRHCKGCIAKDSWDFNGGKEWTQEVKNEFLKLIDKPHITRVSILGGEPLADENYEDVLELIYDIRTHFHDKKIWLYTGFTLESIGWFKAMNHFVKGELNFQTAIDNEYNNVYRRLIIENCDVLVDGQYIDELRDLTLKFRGSSNQRLIDVKKSLEQNEVVLWSI